MKIETINGTYQSSTDLDYYNFIIYKNNFFWIKNPTCSANAQNMVIKKLGITQDEWWINSKLWKCCSILKGFKHTEKPTIEMLPKTYQKIINKEAKK